MARLPRAALPGIPQHVTQRGNNRQACFFAEEDYAVYLDRLKHYAEQYQVLVDAYVLMTNHVHLLLTPKTKEGVSCLMQALGRYYVRYINQSYRRSGTLWEGRFKSSLVDSENYFLIVSRYIELNPVRAGMVDFPADYRWSSYHATALGKEITLLTPHEIYLALGSTPAERQTVYTALFSGFIPVHTLEGIRNATNKACILGSERFKAEIEQQLGRRVQAGLHGGDRRSKAYQDQQL
ncbi:transposase [Amphritea pacifica]|uniref:Transposase n=2 Tax=Amphritea pacifica TaxID=2811233 RepID=A0ABS2WE60_9GAMM|nr:transposase [Amphritea pacifica]MBN0989878.1 transposase [Amphritea pacifica]